MIFEPKEYQEIQTNEEFLQGVRQKVVALQVEANEAARVEAAKRYLRRLRLKFYVIMLALNLPLLLIMTIIRESSLVYIGGLILLTAGAIYENLIETGGAYSGNQDYKFG